MILQKLFAKPLTLKIGAQDLAFATLTEFEFSVAGRTEVPTRKLAELVNLEAADLKREATSIKAIERQFVDILSRSIESQEGLAQSLRRLDPHVFSQDHGWREIMVALRDKDSEYEELRRIALVKYMQYLASRQEIIKYTYSVKRLQNKRGKRGVLDSDPEFSGAGGNRGPAALRETVILDSIVLQPDAAKRDRFTRLPKGEVFEFDVDAGRTIDIMLSKHPFKLVAGAASMELVDDAGTRHALQKGKNIIGRDPVCNVAVDSSYRDVSRMHLIIDRLDDNIVRFTDLSAHGTFLPTDIVVEPTEL